MNVEDILITPCEPKVVQPCIKTVLPNCTTFENKGPLSKATISSLYDFFKRVGHQPSEAMWEALADVAGLLEKMANGNCQPEIYLSSLDPGVGKTQTIVHFIRALLASKPHDDIGVIILVSRLTEIASLYNSLGIPRDLCAVYTSDQELNNLGSSRPLLSRVLLTTQQMVERRCYGGKFQRASPFFYKGIPRQVRIWDESILPGQTITVSRDDLATLLKPLRGIYPDLTETIEQMFRDLKELEDERTFSIPSFSSDHGVDLHEILDVIDGTRQNEISAIESLWFLSGKLASVRRDGALGATLLNYKNTLPDDLGPILVLDASGRVRGTYSVWESKRGGLVRLKKATKTYENLNVHVWSTGGGKTAFRTNGIELIKGIANTINTKPDDDWLIVSHKPETRLPSVEDEVKSMLAEGHGNVHFITWGNHHATNEYRGISNVILAGTLFYRPSLYESLGRLSADYRPEHGPYQDDAYNTIVVGEHAHLILQALCRGSVRQSIGAQCAPCNAYIIASARSGIRHILRTVFPNCLIKRWQPIAPILTGKINDAAQYIIRRLGHHPNLFLKFSEVRNALGGMDASNFRKRIRQHPYFQTAMHEAGIIEYGKGMYNTGFLMANLN